MMWHEVCFFNALNSFRLFSRGRTYVERHFPCTKSRLECMLSLIHIIYYIVQNLEYSTAGNDTGLCFLHCNFWLNLYRTLRVFIYICS